METKKIFVLGNGFDLAHYLPTAYIHFMEAMQVIESSESNTKLGFDDLFQSRLEHKDWWFIRIKELYRTDELVLSVEIVDDLREKLKTNGWFQHFKHHLTDVDTWIDFEMEIEKVLNSFDWIFKTEFEIGTVKNRFTDQDILLEKGILKANDVIISFSYFNKFGILKDSILDLFYTFGLSRSEYFYKKQDSWGCETLEKISNENDFIKSTYRYKNKYENIMQSHFLRRIGENYLGFYDSKIFQVLSQQLKEFSEIFSDYISKFINQLTPIKPFLPFGSISDKVELVFTFNYSNTFQRFYAIKQNKSDITRHLHGDADKRNIVFGISDLDEDLKKYKIFEFVKTYQKIINATDFQFLDEKALNIKKLYDTRRDVKAITSARQQIVKPFNYEVIIWGHSLDISDREYIEEIFALRNENREHKAFIKIYYHETPHSSLANLMNIMGKDIIQEWVKKGWLKFEKSPDIYQAYQDHYKE